MECGAGAQRPGSCVPAEMGSGGAEARLHMGPRVGHQAAVATNFLSDYGDNSNHAGSFALSEYVCVCASHGMVRWCWASNRRWPLAGTRLLYKWWHGVGS